MSHLPNTIKEVTGLAQDVLVEIEAITHAIDLIVQKLDTSARTPTVYFSQEHQEFVEKCVGSGQTAGQRAYKLKFKSTPAPPATTELVTSYPNIVDLTSGFPSVYDQGALGSCVSNGLSNAMRFCMIKDGASSVWIPSRLFIYYNGRVYENEPVSQDTGLSIGGAVLSVNQTRAVSEDLWPYIIADFTFQPPEALYLQAMQNTVFQYVAVPQTLDGIMQSLIAGYPVVIGIQVYQSFESQTVAETGIVPMPDVATESLLGGHCIILCGAKQDVGYFKCLNSWGASWGYNGFFFIPFNYILNPNLGGDYWSIRAFA